MKGDARPNRSATTPPIPGPATSPAAALVATAPSCGDPAWAWTPDIHATPVVHTIPKASPKAKRPATTTP
jgi:hypothetical protein